MREGFVGVCRNPREYFAIFDAAEAREDNGRWARWELVSCKCVDAYVRLKQNQNQARGSQIPFVYHSCTNILTATVRFRDNLAEYPVPSAGMHA